MKKFNLPLKQRREEESPYKREPGDGLIRQSTFNVGSPHTPGGGIQIDGQFKRSINSGGSSPIKQDMKYGDNSANIDNQPNPNQNHHQNREENNQLGRDPIFT